MSSSESKSKSPRAQLTPPDLLSMLHRPPHPHPHPPHPKLTPPDLLSMLPDKSDPKSRSFENPLPRRIYNNPYPYDHTMLMPQQISISPKVSLTPSKAAEHLRKWREQHNITPPEPAELPKKFTTKFRKLMKIVNGNKVILTLNDATKINMGVVNIDHAVSKINPIPNPTTGPITGSFYSIVTPDSNHPLIAHMSPTGIIVLYTPPPPAWSPPPPPTHLPPTRKNGGTIARKMGRKGTNKRRRRHISKTRHRHRRQRRRCMNHTRRK